MMSRRSKRFVDIQEEACVIVRLIREIDIREELGFHRCIGRRITCSVAKVADMERRGQFSPGIVYARIESDPPIIIVPWILFRGNGRPVTIHYSFRYPTFPDDCTSAPDGMKGSHFDSLSNQIRCRHF